MNKYQLDKNFCERVDRVALIIEQKHVAVLIGILLFEGEKHFNELKKEIGCISSKTLSQRLLFLEKKHVITKTSYLSGRVKRTLYSIALKGEKFFPVLLAMSEWAKVV
jgi:DNA-binding HxlR family transcriptional regulator